MSLAGQRTAEKIKKPGFSISGVLCPECGSEYAKTTDSRTTIHQTYHRRRKLCDNGHSYTTHESLVMDSNTDTKNCVVNLLISNDLKYIALTRKARPAWQAGKYNGVGGHIKFGEKPIQAVLREGFEETLWDHHKAEGLRNFATIKFPGCDIYFFTAVAPAEGELYPVLFNQDTTEPVEWLRIEAILSDPEFPLIDNLRWLIPLALQNYPYVEFNMQDQHKSA